MKKSLIALSMALATSLAMAQFDFGGGGGSSKPAWESFKLPNKTMKLDLRNSSVDMVLTLFTKTSGITIIKDPSLTQPITLTSAKAVPLNEAFEILNAALGVRNFELKKDGNLLVIRPKARQGGGSPGGMSSQQISDMMSRMGGGASTELKVYRIEFAAASQVARVVNDVFAQQQASQNPFAALFGGGAQGGRGGRGGGRGGGGFSGFGSTAPTVQASSDDYSNTVIVNAPSKQQKQVEDLIKEIDKRTEDPLKPTVYKLNFAAASDLQPVIQNLLTANAPKGRGAGSSSQPIDRQFSFGRFGGFGGGGQNSQSASVVAESRTNSIVVTTTEQNQALVADVIKELDKEVELTSTTFVFPLDNARADQVANLLRQAFGTRSGSGSTNSGTTQNRTNQNTNQNRNRNQNQNRGGNLGGGLNSLSVDELNAQLDLALQDPNADSGLLQTNVAVQGGVFGQLFGGGGGQQNQNRGSTIQTGRDANGRLIPVQDLTNQVTVIPDPNTNSLIIVTSPENANLIRQILGQLDKIPEQVLIETIIVEASLDANTKLGVEWNFAQDKAFGNTGTTGSLSQGFGTNQAAAQGFKYTLSGGSLTAFMNALHTDTKFNVLSTPRIFTSNNVEAQINISQSVPYVVSQQTNNNGNTIFNYDFQDVGIVLTVTPRITSGGYVTMDVNQTANDLQGFTSFNAPIVNQRQAQTTVAVKDGETVILGGIIRSTVSSTTKKIPILGDIPLLGNLFKSTDKTDSKTELLVFLTPRVVRDPKDAATMTEEQKKKMSKPTQDQLNKAAGGGGEKKADPPKSGGK